MSSNPPRKPSDSELMPPPPRPPARTQSTGMTTTSMTLPNSDLGYGTDTAVPLSTPRARTGVPKHSTERIVDDLRSSLQGYEARANFCCSGGVLVQRETISKPSISSRERITAPPIVLRFDNADDSVSKVQFPPEKNSSSLEELLRSCTAETFGSGGEDILDETYQGPGELDRRNFSVNFHPHDYGIIDTIAQILLPGINRPLADASLDSREEHWGVRAELDKLTIYSAPSAKFQKRIDTPRRGLQFGTLIVCLPYSHQGGQLLLTHKSQQVAIDWSNPAPNSISWSAFYSACTYEVLPVTDGHRITLTYDLFVCERVGRAVQRYPSADPTLYPLYQTVKSLLSDPDFLPDGGTLALPLTHLLPHTSRPFPSLLPYNLQGIDSVFFSVFSSLGLHTTIRPVFGDEAWDEYAQYRFDEELEIEELEEKGELTRVGEFGRIRMLNEGMGKRADPTRFLTRHLRLQELQDVIWLNEAKHEGWEVQVVHLKDANEDGDEIGEGKDEDVRLMWHYSCAVIFVEVGGWRDRGLVVARGARKGKGRQR